MLFSLSSRASHNVGTMQNVSKAANAQNFRLRALLGAIALGGVLVPSMANASLYFSGIYGSLGLGAILTKGKHKYFDPNGATSQSDLGNLGGITSFHAGYITEKGESTVMLGGELYALKAFNNIRKGMNLPDGTRIGSVNIKHNMAYGAAFILGKLINPKIMVYGKIAYEFGGIKYDYKELSFSDAPNWSRTDNYRKFIPGAGFRYAMADKFHVGFEYSLAPIGKKQIKNDNNSTDGANRRTEAKILDNRFLITLTYQFTTPKGNK